MADVQDRQPRREHLLSTRGGRFAVGTIGAFGSGISAVLGLGGVTISGVGLVLVDRYVESTVDVPRLETAGDTSEPWNGG